MLFRCSDEGYSASGDGYLRNFFVDDRALNVCACRQSVKNRNTQLQRYALKYVVLQLICPAIFRGNLNQVGLIGVHLLISSGYPDGRGAY